MSEERLYTMQLKMAPPALVEFLISRGAEVSGQDNIGQTPLFCAAKAGQKEIVEILIAHGADVNVQAKSNHLPCSGLCAMGIRK